jgi:hypothetical protein
MGESERDPIADEEAEAAAAEAARIGGPAPDDPVEDPAERPLVEAGEGEAEGQEQTEAELAAAAEPTAPGMSEEERQIEDAIEAAGNPTTPEQVEPLVSGGESADEAQQRADEPAADEGAEWRTWSGRSVNP